ncbi:OmpA family protein [Mangrovimonas sp. AS39]|uniref:OmpA family protein n=1 Tax=Mangrovimonas TaxID=1211036 RepID=UPI0006B69441|nr:MULTISPECIES: OmpA family protein [Mangrovimonas]MCF1190375.1 OmpA family protein [Mangrovimonas futianensis]MCF1193872.1 OmpA family protein [Mangrovimonas futianensis]MCF1420869.1 OmpA family protein [Mangrovimonas futianensis]NIK90924.1 OmpA family protein [Mangrovimonas sp. CR14]
MKNLLFIWIFVCSFNALAQKEFNHVVYFETDQFDVPETERSRLLLFISTLDTVDIERVSIYGFCDDRGSTNYNLDLSQKRANSIKTIFSNNELDDSKISNVDGKGEILLKVVQEENVEKIRGLNRKVEIIVHPYDPPRKEKKTTPEEAQEFREIINGDLKTGDKVTLNNILFKTGYTTLLPESKPVLDDIAKVLIERDDIYFTIQGHVCCTKYSRDAVDRKTKKRNLSLARAKYIYDYLAKSGVDKKRMKYVGLRRKFPLGGEAKFDRRVEILITYVGDNN